MTGEYKSPLHKMIQTTQTCLWNDSAWIEELSYAIEHGAVGATCNPIIALTAAGGTLFPAGSQHDRGGATQKVRRVPQGLRRTKA